MDLANKVGLESGLLLAVLLLVSSIMILIFFGFSILTVVITVVYPSVQSIKALESPAEDDDKVWLTYWLMFGIATLLDEFAGIILQFIPLYFWLRLLFFVYLMAPQTRGASTLYHTLIGPIMRQHKDKIQRFIDEIKGSASDAMSEAKKEGLKQLNDPNNLMRAAQMAQDAQNTLKQ